MQKNRTGVSKREGGNYRLEEICVNDAMWVINAN